MSLLRSQHESSWFAEGERGCHPSKMVRDPRTKTSVGAVDEGQRERKPRRPTASRSKRSTAKRCGTEAILNGLRRFAVWSELLQRLDVVTQRMGPSTPWPALTFNNDKASARAPLHESMDPHRKSQAWRTRCCKRGGSWRALALDNWRRKCRTTSLPLRTQARQDEPDHAHLPTQGADVVSGAELPTKQHH